ncbi:hypothetical protein PALS2_035 [Staphylococcus phage PALS_2]|nr:hypothetical protein PALS2_035 [Staphylococcus phage PALS_2]
MTKEMDEIIKNLESKYVDPDLENDVYSERYFSIAMVDGIKNIFDIILKEIKDKDNVSDIERLDTERLQPRNLMSKENPMMKNFFDIAYEVIMENKSMISEADSLSSSFVNFTNRNRVVIKMNKTYLGFRYIEIMRNNSGNFYINLANYDKTFKPNSGYYDDQLCITFRNKTFRFHYLTYNYNS